MEAAKNELEELRLAVAKLEAEVQRLRGEVARAPARGGAGGDEGPGGYDPWVKAYGGGGTSIEGTETGSDAASGALKVYSATDARVEVVTSDADKTVTIGVYYV